LRAFVAPSPMSTGQLFGSELPPIRLVPAEPTPPARRDGRRGRIRRDDLTGRFRPDPVLGYAPREDATSSNGWWQSNNLGARARHDTAAAAVPGTIRVLVFGDSFAAGSRVPQESAWPALLAAAPSRLEVVNFGVDGYSTAQSLLRYRALGDRIAHHVVLLTVSPRASFWRDVNTLRALAGWRLYTMMPRFVLADGRLRLVPSPYDPPETIFADNRDGPSARLQAHLRAYDHFYVPWMHEPLPTPLASSVLARFVLARWHTALLRHRHRQVLEPGSEAVQLIARMAQAMRDEAAARNADFLLVLLPSERDLAHLRRGGYLDRWRAIAAALAHDGVECLDLADDLLAAPDGTLDRGFDGTHHGPRTNARVATAVGRTLAAQRTTSRTSPHPIGAVPATRAAPGVPPPAGASRD
jgi:hypothetical protein